MTRSLLLAVIVASALAPTAFSQPKSRPDGLLADPYPGSAPEQADSFVQNFYTKEPPAAVKSHYAKAVTEPFAMLDADSNAYYGGIIGRQEVLSMLRGRGIDYGEAGGWTNAGVTVAGRTQNENYSVRQVIDALKSAYTMRFMNEESVDLAARLKDPEIVDAVGKYEYLLHSRFIATRGTTKDKELFDEYYTKAGEKAAKEQSALSEKMQVLMLAQKYDEATKVGDEMTAISTRQTDAPYNWGVAIKCLDEMARNAYATRITIDKHPSVWYPSVPKR